MSMLELEILKVLEAVDATDRYSLQISALSGLYIIKIISLKMLY